MPASVHRRLLTTPSGFERTIPDSTSAEALEGYVPGEGRLQSRGHAGRSLGARLLAQRGTVFCCVPAVAEPCVVCVRSGAALVEEREPGGDWTATEARPNVLYLTAPGSAYELRIRVEGDEPLVTLQVLLSRALFEKAASEVFGAETLVCLRSVSGVHDELLLAMTAALERELHHRWPSTMMLDGLGQSLAVHLVRDYADAHESCRKAGLPGHILVRVRELLTASLPTPFCLARCAAVAGTTEWHFSRAFKKTTGLSPSRYFLNLRMEAARRLLRETRRSVTEVGLEVGYTSPSHFSHVFRRETGITPVRYRRQL